MTDRMDAKLTAITTELASAAPLAPPMPDLSATRHGQTRHGIRTAAVAFALIIVAAVTGFGTWMQLSTSQTSTPAAAIFEAAGGTPVAFVTRDGVDLRGYLWSGSTTGVVIVTAYGQSSSELIPLARAAAETGATVMLVNPRGQESSGGHPLAETMVPDLEDAVADLETRGVDDVVVVGMRHSATAALVLSADPPESVVHTMAFFPFEQYQGVDAMGVIARTEIPLTILGASSPSVLGPWAGHLIDAAPPQTDGEVLRPIPPDVLFTEFYMSDMVNRLVNVLP